jgi:hypothetical protein
VSVELTALDERGNAIVTVSAVPSTERIAANGGTARFRADIERDARIRTYHVSAVAR